MQSIILLLIISLQSCSYSFDKNGSWKSDHHKVSIELTDPMKLLSDKLDEKDKLLVLCTDSQENQGFVIKVDKDVPLDQLTDQTYYDGLKQTMLNPNPENRLLSETDTLFHKENYHSMIFYMNTSKGSKKLHCNILRKEGFMYSIQIFYPCEKEEAMSSKIPIALINQDKLIKINEK